MEHHVRSFDVRPGGGRPCSRGNEVVLVAGADLAAREAPALEALGYRVLQAADGRAALDELERGTAVDLLMAPVAAAGAMRGAELAACVREAWPTMAVLLAGDAPPDASDRAAAGIEFLDERHGPDDLALRVRHVLGNQQQVNALAKVLRQTAPQPAPVAAADPHWRVLLVEDQDEVRDTSRQLLELLGCEVRAVPDAESADDALQHCEFDVMLTDITLPGRSGLELARTAAVRQPALRIIVSSGYGRNVSRLPGVRTWALPKPYGVRELEALLGEFARS
jgi:CheY-like chemotaxis protein